MDILNILISVIGGSAILVTAAAFLTMKLIDNRLNREIESYKTKLKVASDSEIEKLKSRLQVVAKEREITVNWLHQKRATAIEDLFSSLVDLQHSVRIVLDLFSPHNPKDIRKYTEDAVVKVWDVYAKYKKAKIFLNTKTCQKIEEVISGIEEPTIMYSAYLGNYDDDELHTLKDVKKHAWEELRERVTPAMQELENEFRSVLGVEIG